MDKNASENRKKFGVLDFFIILIVILCIAGIGIRVYFRLHADKQDSFSDAVKEYAVSYVAKNQRSFVQDYLSEGAEFRFSVTGEKFGVPGGKPLVQPAEVDVVASDGTHRQVYNTSVDERTDRNDLRGSFIVRGVMSEDGLLKVEGSEEIIALNREYSVESDLLVFSFTVTGITVAS